MSVTVETHANTINEGSTEPYTKTLVDGAGTVIPLSAIDSLTLTLSNVYDGEIINSRELQDALNDNNVTVHDTSGLLTYILQPLDTAIQDAAVDTETHRATFKLTYNSGTNAANWDVDFVIRNLSKI